MSEPDRQWTIGAAADCDLVVEQQTVSGRHCRLQRQAGQWYVEDLGSTNGVYVNGEKIVERRLISPSDDVTLGKNVPLPWPAEAQPPAQPQPLQAQPVASAPPVAQPVFPGTKITIGRNAGNDVVLSDPSVSSKHAVLTVADGLITLEDLQSSNGTYVGPDHLRIQQTLVQPNDVVFLGSVETTVTNLLLSTDKTIAGISLNLPPLNPPAAAPTPAPRSRKSKQSSLPVNAALGGAVALIVVIAFLIWNRPSAENVPPAAAANAAPATPSPAEETVSVRSMKAAPSSKSSDPADAIYLLMIADPAMKERYRIGAAVAVGPRTLLTSATCQTVAALVKDQYPQLVLQGADSQPRVNKITVHPTYLSKYREGDDAERKFTDLIAKVEQIGSEQDMTSQLRDAYKHYLTITDQPQHYDVAVIEVDADLPAWLPLAPATNLAPLSALSVYSFAFDQVAPFWDAQSLLSPRIDKGRVRQTFGQVGDANNPRLLVGQLPQVAAADHLGLNFSGAAILDSQQRLVALYSRITPERELGSPPTGEQFDATVVADVADFLQPYLPTSNPN
ncbi:FHA domain-containing protein [Blastopirellula marina]|uniref:FHA domain-containing protein n=1 Tax=Blastopirellula marina TaxID=124 RepID=A0A2S8GR28_9BACT|nr:FHA domain-containing protein [Blastopirellula marina]PQO46877.1 hypothetical protein C5Y93_06920 [Blastopirellula marina]